MLGGDSQPSPRKGTAGSDEGLGSAVSVGRDPSRDDPGDREEPLKREDGDPFEPGLKDIQRAARTEGRKFKVVFYRGMLVSEVLYRIDRFRRFLPNRGSDGKGLIQFWGPRAVRRYNADEKPSGWIPEKRGLQTVNVGDISFVKEPKRRIKIKVR